MQWSSLHKHFLPNAFDCKVSKLYKNSFEKSEYEAHKSRGVFSCIFYDTLLFGRIDTQDCVCYNTPCSAPTFTIYNYPQPRGDCL